MPDPDLEIEGGKEGGGGMGAVSKGCFRPFHRSLV